MPNFVLNLFFVIRILRHQDYILRSTSQQQLSNVSCLSTAEMRYLDWDVLLFPTGEEGAHVPAKEFRTACFIEQMHDDAVNPAPVLTTFIPSLHRDAPFQISIHSWSPTGPMLAPAMDGTKLKEEWQAKVVIDGHCVSIENFPIDANWPQVICTFSMPTRISQSLTDSAATTSSATGQEGVARLRFPPFHHTITSQSHWDAADLMGRIRLELSTGYVDVKHHRFVKMFNVVNFSFQPAPIGKPMCLGAPLSMRNMIAD